MKRLARRALCCALALAAAASTAVQASVDSTWNNALILPAELANVCEADQQALHEAIRRYLQPANSIDQWTQLVRSFSCDLSGSRDLGWHRVPLRAYESAIRYPLTWIENEPRELRDQRGDRRGTRQRRQVRTFHSAAQLPARIDFWVGGRIDEIRYESRQRRLDARFSANGGKSATQPCTATTLQFRQQNGIWLLSGVESLCTANR